MDISNMKIILASKSPRRRELLTQAGFQYEIEVSDKEEEITAVAPARVAMDLSFQKAQVIFDKHEEDNILVIGADTIVALGETILGKPKDEEEAVKMLQMLSGKTHQVYTGVTFMYRKDGKEENETFFERTYVTFYPMTQEEIEGYVATKDSLDKAGAYGIQGKCAVFIKEIKGDYNNVVGLPIGKIYQELRNL